MGVQRGHRYWSHSRATSRLLSCHQAEAAQLLVSEDSAHLFCFKAQNFENNHFMSHKTDWQLCSLRLTTMNPKVFCLFVDRFLCSPSQPQTHQWSKISLNFCAYAPKCCDYRGAIPTQFVQSQELGFIYQGHSTHQTTSPDPRMSYWYDLQCLVLVPVFLCGIRPHTLQNKSQDESSSSLSLQEKDQKLFPLSNGYDNMAASVMPTCFYFPITITSLPITSLVLKACGNPIFIPGPQNQMQFMNSLQMNVILNHAKKNN